MSKSLANPSSKFPNLFKQVMFYFTKTLKIVGLVIQDLNNSHSKLQKASIRKRQGNLRSNTDGRKSYRAGNFH